MNFHKILSEDKDKFILKNKKTIKEYEIYKKKLKK